MAKKKLRKLPKKLYVWVEADGADGFLLAADSIDGFEEGVKVGVYELKEKKKLVVTRKLV